MPLVAAAFAAGDLTADHVRRLATAFGRTRAVFAEHEAVLVSWALSKSFLEFCIELDVWLLEHDPDGTSKKARDQRDRRDAWLAESFDGMYLGQMTLDPTSGSIVAAEFRRLEQQLFDGDWREARERLGRDPHVSELRRTPAQRRADALVEMAKRSARPNAGSAPKPLFTVVLGPLALLSVCQLGCGQVISPEALRPYLDEAQMEAIRLRRSATTDQGHPQTCLRCCSAPDHRGQGSVLQLRVWHAGRALRHGSRNAMDRRRHDRHVERPAVVPVVEQGQGPTTLAAAVVAVSGAGRVGET